MQVSVILPNYNHAVFLQKRIDSIFNQSFTDFELIILYDFSTDNSKEIIEQYREHPHVSHIVYNTENSGSTFKQWGKGIELAKG
jgi:glycosyltransferase involved in cell wall biosynthesis